MITAMDVKIDRVLERIHAIELGIAGRGGKWAIISKLGLFIAGIASAVAGALIIGNL